MLILSNHPTFLLPSAAPPSLGLTSDWWPTINCYPLNTFVIAPPPASYFTHRQSTRCPTNWTRCFPYDHCQPMIPRASVAQWLQRKIMSAVVSPLYYFLSLLNEPYLLYPKSITFASPSTIENLPESTLISKQKQTTVPPRMTGNQGITITLSMKHVLMMLGCSRKMWRLCTSMASLVRLLQWMLLVIINCKSCLSL